jgi:hypothetical protein
MTPDEAVEDAPAPIPADAPPGDTYSREQAGRVLGVSARRISQLAGEGRLDVVQESPLRVSASSVHAMREERRNGRDLRARRPPEDVAVLVAEAREAGREEARRDLLLAITAGEPRLADTQAERDRLLADLEAERQRVVALASRRWWRRRPS